MVGKYFSRKAVRDIARWVDQVQNPPTIAENIERYKEKEKAEERQRELLRKRKRSLSGLSDEQIEAEECRIRALMKEGD